MSSLRQSTASTTALVAFLRARLAEDEQAAQAAKPGPWHTDGGSVYASHPTDQIVDYARDDSAAHIARHHPARVLREIEWNRRMVHAFDGLATNPARLHDAALHMQYEIFRRIVCGIALSYVDHSDYREEWRP